MATGLEVDRTQFLHLTRALEAKRPLTPVQLRDIRKPLTQIPAVDAKRLKAIGRDIELRLEKTTP